MKKAILEFENEDELLDAAYIMAFKECRDELRLHLNGLDIE